MINLVMSDIKRLRWIWLIFTVAILINLYSGISSYRSSLQSSQAWVKMHEMKGDIDILRIQGAKMLWEYPYYLKVGVLPNVILFLSLQTLVISSGLIARESERGALQLLLSFPINRRKLLVSKYLAGLLSLIASIIMIYFVIYLLTLRIGVAFSVGNLFLLAGLQFLQFLVIHGYTFLLSVWFSKQIVALGTSGILSLALFLNPLVRKGVIGDARTGYLNTGLILSKGIIPWEMVLLMAISLLALFVLSLFIFERREMSN